MDTTTRWAIFVSSATYGSATRAGFLELHANDIGERAAVSREGFIVGCKYRSLEIEVDDGSGMMLPSHKLDERIYKRLKGTHRLETAVNERRPRHWAGHCSSRAPWCSSWASDGCFRSSRGTARVRCSGTTHEP